MDALQQEMLAEEEKIAINIDELMVLTPPYQENLQNIEKRLSEIEVYRDQLIAEAEKLTTQGNAKALKFIKILTTRLFKSLQMR